MKAIQNGPTINHEQLINIVTPDIDNNLYPE